MIRASAACNADRAVGEAEGPGRPRGHVHDRGLRGRRVPGRGHVDRLLEERAVERIRLVEHRERAERAALEQPLQRDLDAGDERLDQDLVGPLAQVRHVGRAWALSPDDRVLQFASLAFDASAEEIYPTLCSGAALVLRDDAFVSSPRAFV